MARRRSAFGGGIARALLVPAVTVVALPAVAVRRTASAAADRLVPVLASAVLSRLDLDAVAARIDVDALVDRVDIDRVLARTDVAGLARYIAAEIDLPDLLRATAGTASSELTHGVRDRSAQADLVVAEAIDRFLHRAERQPGDRAHGPAG